MTKNEAIQKALLLESANANLVKLCDKQQKTIEQYRQQLIKLTALPRGD